MQNFSIHFSNAWFLLLLIPAAFFTLFPYFRLAKRYRRTRNRITSIVLHSLVMIMMISLLAGTTFAYSVPNKENELIFLVDMSESEENSAQTRDKFVEDALKYADGENYKISLVKFGYDQVLATPFTYDVDKVIDSYKNDELMPDTTATDIAAALNYAKDLFTNPESGKIVLVTDGKETDEKSDFRYKKRFGERHKIDVAYVPSSYDKADALITNVKLPDTYVKADDEVDITVSLKAKKAFSADGSTPSSFEVKLTLSDNGVEDTENAQLIELSAGTKDVTLKHVFTASADGDNFHEIKVSLTSESDTLAENNAYYTYTVMQNFNKVLVLQSRDGDSDELEKILDIDQFKTDDDGAKTSTVKVLDIVKEYNEDYFPKTLDALRQYDQIILNNVSYSDMPEGFEEMIYTYVNDYGGGLFTIGGNDDADKAHGYNREDMAQSEYLKQLLPVELINYTPPVGLMIIVDRSDSMNTEDSQGRKYIDLAKAGAMASLNALTDRDYVGIMSLDTYAATILPLTQRTRESEIVAAIDSIGKADGGTVYTQAIIDAGNALRTLKTVEKRHIMLVSDGEPNENASDYEKYIKEFNERDGTTFSVVIIGKRKPADADELDKVPLEDIDDPDKGISSETAYGKCLRITKIGGGKLHWIANTDDVSAEMREDLNIEAVKESDVKDFYPIIYDRLSNLLKNVDINDNKLKVRLNGFYGAKIKSGADLILVGDYTVPIYAQWRYGKGMVGSFMSDLNGNWSSEFLGGPDSKGDTNGGGIQFILNVITNLMPTNDIRPSEITAELKEDNYTNRLSVYADLENGETVNGTIAPVNDETQAVSLNEEGGNEDFYVTSPLALSNNYTRCNFVVKKSGIYKITLEKVKADGTKIQTVIYKSFSYSKEYDTTLDTEVDYAEQTKNISSDGNGEFIQDLEGDLTVIFESFVTRLAKSFDPRWLFAILSIVFFLADVAVRKFKFKWPHELIIEFRKRKPKT